MKDKFMQLLSFKNQHKILEAKILIVENQIAEDLNREGTEDGIKEDNKS